jgi:hypothetical protein
MTDGRPRRAAVPGGELWVIIKGRFTPPNQPKHEKTGSYGEGAFAYPVIANGRLYIHDLGTLWVYDIKG